MRDFTIEKYGSLCHTLIDAGYTPMTVHQYLKGDSDGRIVVLRHDVDRRPGNALQMAEFEHTLGFHATYYFRHPYTFIPMTIERISSLGHEIGYHYEVLSKASGDYKKAIALFAQELGEFRNLCDIHTICMHGRPLSRYDNRDLWKKYDFRSFGIEGEAYLSMAERGLRYLTDTGRSWDGRHSVRDIMPSIQAISMETTNDLIDWIRSDCGEELYLTVHPERWAVREGAWATGYVKDLVVNFGKKVLMTVK